MAALYEYRLIPASFTPPPPGPRGGETFVPEEDTERLNKQQQRVWDHMIRGGWHTLREISRATGDPEASISARLRDFRKEQFGRHEVERRAVPEHEHHRAL